MSKKFTAVILALAMAFTLAFASVTGAFAADSEDLTVKATSNLFSESSAVVSADQTQVRVTFTLETAKDILNMDGELIYDPAVLTPAKSEDPISDALPVFSESGSVVYNGNSDLYSLKYGADDSRRVVAFNASNMYLYDFSSGEKVFITMLFDVNSAASASETTVELWLKYLTTSELASNGLTDPTKELYPVDQDGVVYEDICSETIKSAASSVTALPEVQETTAEPQETTTEPQETTTEPQETTTEPQTPTTEPTSTSPAETSFIYGDANSDNIVDIGDVTAIQKAIAMITELNDTQKLAADVTGDNTVDITDATTIQKFVAQIIDIFPVESGE